MRDVVDTIVALSDALETRDLDAALGCFSDEADAMFAPSETDDYAFGPQAIEDVLRGILARDESYSWTVQHMESADGGDFRIVLGALTVSARRGEVVETWTTQLSGVLQYDRTSWRWRNLCGVLPCVDDVAARFRDGRRSQVIPAPATPQLRT